MNKTIRRDIKILGQKEMEVEGTGRENLLYNFLEEFLSLLDAEDFLIVRIKDAKIVTSGEMFARVKNDKFICEVVLDA